MKLFTARDKTIPKYWNLLVSIDNYEPRTRRIFSFMLDWPGPTNKFCYMPCYLQSLQVVSGDFGYFLGINEIWVKLRVIWFVTSKGNTNGAFRLSTLLKYLGWLCETWLEKHGSRGSQITSNFKSKLQVWHKPSMCATILHQYTIKLFNIYISYLITCQFVICHHVIVNFILHSHYLHQIVTF